MFLKVLSELIGVPAVGVADGLAKCPRGAVQPQWVAAPCGCNGLPALLDEIRRG